MALAAGQTGHLADHQEGVYQVTHGGTAGTARPTLGSASTTPNVVLWNGTVEPTNAVNGDVWWDETNSLLKVKVSGSFVASGSAAYEPLVTQVFIPARLFDAIGVGAPTFSHVNRWSGWLLDANATELVSATIGAGIIPAGWTTADADYWYVNAGAGSGNVSVRLKWDSEGDGDTLTTAASGPGLDTTATAAAQNVAEVIVDAATAITVDPDKLLQLEARRSGNAAPDTLANDILFLGVMLRKG